MNSVTQDVTHIWGKVARNKGFEPLTFGFVDRHGMAYLLVFTHLLVTQLLILTLFKIN